MGRYAAGKRIPRPAIMRRIVLASGAEVQPNDFFLDVELGEPAAGGAALNADAVAIDVLICDMCGVLRGKRLAPGSWDKLRGGTVVMPASTYALDITGSNVFPAFFIASLVAGKVALIRASSPP